MIVHDLKHPTESLIDSLQLVMRSLKNLEQAFYSLLDTDRDIKMANSGIFLQLQEVREHLETLNVKLSSKDQVSHKIGQDCAANILNKNRSDKLKLSKSNG